MYFRPWFSLFSWLKTTCALMGQEKTLMHLFKLAAAAGKTPVAVLFLPLQGVDLLSSLKSTLPTQEKGRP